MINLERYVDEENNSCGRLKFLVDKVEEIQARDREYEQEVQEVKFLALGEDRSNEETDSKG